MTDAFSFKQGSFILMWFFGTWTKPIVKCVGWIFVICVISSRGRGSYFPSHVTGHEQLSLGACFSNVCFKTLLISLVLFSTFPILWGSNRHLFKISSFSMLVSQLLCWINIPVFSPLFAREVQRHFFVFLTWSKRIGYSCDSSPLYHQGSLIFIFPSLISCFLPCRCSKYSMFIHLRSSMWEKVERPCTLMELCKSYNPPIIVSD